MTKRLQKFIRVIIGNLFVKAFFAGGVLALAFAPFDLILAIPVSFTMFMLLLEKHCKSYQNALKFGWFFGFGYFLISLYWIGNALFARIESFWWLVPFAYIGIPAFAAIYIMPAALCFYLTKNTYLKPIMFSVAWFASEYFRANYFLPFPWNTLGYAMAANDYTIQMAYYLGLYGCTALLLVFGTIFYLRKPPFIICGLAIALIVPTAGYIRLNNAQSEFWDFSVRLVQPNPGGHHFGDNYKMGAQLENLIRLSSKNLPANNKLIVWPESAFPYLVTSNANYISILNKIASQDGILFFGADRVETDAQPRRYYNSSMAIDRDGIVEGGYDKEILVPFGEYIPFKKALSFLNIVAYGIGEFTSGNNPTDILHIKNLPSFRPLICYEVIFPSVLSDSKMPEFFLAITNDSWYGNTSGPYQHLNMARFTAAQYGVPIIRSAISGVSAIINPYGQVIASLGFNTEGVLDYKLPKRIIAG